MSAGLIEDDAKVACNGVTACDHAINAATANPIPIVPVEKNSLNMVAALVFLIHAIMSQWRFRILPLPPKKCRVKPLVSWVMAPVSSKAPDETASPNRDLVAGVDLQEPWSSLIKCPPHGAGCDGPGEIVEIMSSYWDVLKT